MVETPQLTFAEMAEREQIKKEEQVALEEFKLEVMDDGARGEAPPPGGGRRPARLRLLKRASVSVTDRYLPRTKLRNILTKLSSAPLNQFKKQFLKYR